MNKKHTVFIVVASIVYVAYHLLTLTYSPLPWFDEVSFAGITESYIKNNNFFEATRQLSWDGEKLMYGPVYFALQAAVVKTLGFSMFTFRVSGFLFGLVNLYLIYRICRHLQFKTIATVLTVTIVALDPMYNQFLHNGRMDMLTLFFFLGSYLIFVKADYNRPSYLLYGIVTGALLGAAMLTNPRISFTFLFYVGYFFYEFIGKKGTVGKVLLKYVALGATFLSLYAWWIYGKFGSLENFVAVNYTNSKLMREHIGFSLDGWKLNQSVLFYAYAVFAAVLLFKRRKEGKNAELLLLTLPVIVGFNLLISGAVTGRYYALIAPFTTLLYIGGTVNIFESRGYKWVGFAVVGVFAALFAVKAMVIAASLDSRDKDYYSRQLAAVIPKGATAVADFPYYYMLRQNDNEYQCLEENGVFPQKIKFLREKKYDFVVMSTRNVDTSLYRSDFLKDYEFVAHVVNNKQPNGFAKAVKKLPYRIHDSYDCYVYRRILGSGHGDSLNVK
ncbi:MAG: glycosyltransferase family 39 protein [Bacteroidota bacterium]